MTKTAFEKKLGNLEVLRKAWRLETLRKVPILSKLSPDEARALSDELTDVSFRENETIVRQGDKGDAMFILESGEVEVVDEKTLDAEGAPKLLCKLGPSSYFGELGLLNSETRAATVRVPHRATVLIITRRTFEQHLGNLKDILKRNAEEMYAKSGSGSYKKPVTAELEELQTIGFLGVGSFGRVTLVAHDGETYALKEIGKAQVVARGLVEHVWREKQTMAQCDSPFLVNLRRTYVSERSIYMLMDKVLGGELFTYLQTRNSPLPEAHAKFYAACVVLAFEYLHDRQITYRDLKPENLLICTNGYLKVTDFSFAKKLPKGAKTFTLCGTPQYLAPEQVQQVGHNRAVDWWAVGVLVYELVNGVPPFNQDDHYQMYKAINEVKFHFSPRNGPKFRAVVSGLLRRMPASRLGMGKTGAREIKQHEWFADINWSALAQQRARAPYVPLVEDVRDLRHFVDTGDDVPGLSAKWGTYASIGRFTDF
jgi:cGMP-dependent protein kinase